MLWLSTASSVLLPCALPTFTLPSNQTVHSRDEHTREALHPEPGSTGKQNRQEQWEEQTLKISMDLVLRVVGRG